MHFNPGQPLSVRWLRGQARIFITPPSGSPIWKRPSRRTRPTGCRWQQRKSICSVLLEANLPECVTHNDTKFNNVMLDDAAGEGVPVLA